MVLNILKERLQVSYFWKKLLKKRKKKFRPSHLRAVRKAIENNIIVKESQDIGSFYTILKNNLEIRHGVTPTHTLKELKHLFQIYFQKSKIIFRFFLMN